MAKTTIVIYPRLSQKNKKTGQTLLYLRVSKETALDFLSKDKNKKALDYLKK